MMADLQVFADLHPFLTLHLCVWMVCGFSALFHGAGPLRTACVMSFCIAVAWVVVTVGPKALAVIFIVALVWFFS